MHIAEGLLSLPLLVGSSLVAAVGINLGLRRLDPMRMPIAAMLAAVFFIASLIHLPIGFSSVHLVMSGLCGLLLGWTAFPVIVVALFLQSILFGFGGLTTLGINTLIMGLPAVMVHYLFAPNLIKCSVKQAFWRGAAAGSLAIALGALLLSGTLVLNGGSAFYEVSSLILVSHLPIMLVEGMVTGSIIAFLHRVEPSLLEMANYVQQTT
jgi:cobalt/nickel transport system permease protein